MTAAASDRTTTGRRGRRPRPSKEQRQGGAVLLSALVAPIASATPVGSGVGDALWLAALAALAALLGSTAKRGPLLVAVIVAVVSTRSFLALGLAAIAIAFAALSTRKLRRRGFFARGIVAGATVISLSVSATELPWWLLVPAILGVGLPIVVSGLRNAPPRFTRRATWLGLAAAAFAVGGSALAVAGALDSANEVDAGTVELQLGLAAAREGDLTGASAHLGRAQALFSGARSSIARWGLLGRAVPITAQHVEALTKVLDDVSVAAEQAIRTSRTVDSADLAVRSGLVDVDAVAKLANPLRRLSNALGELVAESREQRRGPLLPIVEDRLQRMEVQAARAAAEAEDGAQAADVMPGMLGADGPKRYLVLFTSPAEARGRFGFPGSFAELLVDRGRLRLGEHGSVSATFRDLQPDQALFPFDDDHLQPFLPFATTRTMLSATIPPDFPTVGVVAASLWESSGRPPIDGVLRFDPSSLAPLLDYTGAVDVPTVPAPLTSANLESFLLFEQYVQFPSDQAPRREVLETVAEVTFERLVNADLPAPRGLIDRFGALVRSGHLQVTSFDRSAATFLDRVQLDGRLDPPAADGLLVANVNSGGNKIDAFLTKDVTYEAAVDGDAVTGTVQVDLTNAAPAARLPLYVIGSAIQPPLPRGTNRTTLHVYTAVEPRRIQLDGQPVAGRILRSGGWWLAEVLVELPPGATRSVEVTVEGELPESSGGDYGLRIEPGGGVVPDSYSVAVRTDGEDISFGGRVITPVAMG